MKKSFEAYFLGSRTQSGQASKWRLLLYFLFISDIFAVAYIGDTFATGFLAARYAMYGAVLVFTSGMLAIRTRISFALLANLFVAVCLLIVAILSLFSGMIFSMVFPWFVLIPVMATLLLSERSGWIWLMVSLLAITILIGLEGTGWKPVASFVPPSPMILQTSLVIGLLLILFFIVRQFEIHQAGLLHTIEKQNDEMAFRRETLEVYNEVLMQLTRNVHVQKGDFQLAPILQTGQTVLNVSRTSLWKYERVAEQLVCEGLLISGATSLSRGDIIRQADHQPYFDALLGEEVILASNAHLHPATASFSKGYLNALNIRSMLDIPIVYQSELYGVLCCEQNGSEREWSAEDVTFAKSLSDIIAVALAQHQQLLDRQQIEAQNLKISVTNEELLRVSDELRSLNGSLELRVKERTQTLEEQNKRLTEYAFINAHLLRGPLCSIMGLVNLLELTKDTGEQEEIVRMLQDATGNLDDVIKRVTHLLDNRQLLSRDDLNENRS